MSDAEIPRTPRATVVKVVVSGGISRPGEAIPDAMIGAVADDAVARDQESDTIGEGLLGPGYETVQEAVLSGFPAGEARVLSIEVSGDEADLEVEVNPQTGYCVSERCLRRNGRWYVM